MGPEGKPGKDGVNGTDGAKGGDGVSIVWKGAFASDAALAAEKGNPQPYWLYYNTTDKEARIYTASGVWETLAKDGEKGADGANGTDALPLYAVIFVGNAGEPIYMQAVTKGGKAAEPAVPLKDGWVFLNWYADKGLTERYDFNKTVTDHLTVYSEWVSAADDEDFGRDAAKAGIPAFDVSTKAGWEAAVAEIVRNGSGSSSAPKNYVINVTADVADIAGVAAATFGNAADIAVSIRGGASRHKLSLPSGGGSGNLLRVGANQRVFLRDVTLKGTSTNNTSLVYINGANAALVMRGSTQITDNTSGFGGGVRVNSGAFTMRDSAAVSGNTATSNGGGVLVAGGTFAMQDSATVSGNTATSNGGGVAVSDGTFTMQGSATVSRNTSGSGFGGGVYVSIGTFTMQGSAAVSGNTATNSGGGVYVGYNATFTMQGSAAVSGNKASGSGSGGGVYVGVDGNFTMQDSAAVSGNTATNGGGVLVDGANATFAMQGSAAVSGNSATNGGGGVLVDSGGNFTMQNSATVSGNTATNGGGVLVDGGAFRISGGTVYGSEAGETLKNTAASGAALCKYSGTAQHGTFDGTTTGTNIPLDSDPYHDATIKVAGGQLVTP